jgi:aminopeptidase C
VIAKGDIATMAHQLTRQEIEEMQVKFADNSQAAVVQRAAMRNGVLEASYNSKAKEKLNRTFSVEVETGGVTNQRHSGRCWLFATLNTLRHQFAKKYKLKDFELSQAYLYFWDKIERANIFYDRILETADRPTDDRLVKFYLTELGGPGGDGGQWAMAAGLIEKYGVVPSYAMPETFNTNDTTGFAQALNLKLRHDAKILRELKTSGANTEKLNARRQALLAEVYRMTAIAVGEPPATFDLEYKDDDKKYHLKKDLTPQQFFKDYFDMDPDNYVVLTNSPDKAYGKRYSLPSQDNIVGGQPITFVNVEMDALHAAAVSQLKDGQTVWFGNDVLKQMNRKEGLLDTELYKTAELFTVDLTMSKAERLQYGEAEVSHAMTLTGVDLDGDHVRQWKVENSWGDKNGEKGYFVMSDDWFEQFTYEVVIQRKYLTKAQLAIADSTPIPLPAWDSLA